MGLKTDTDLVKGLRYKLQLTGITIEGPDHMCFNNISVVQNSVKPESTLKKIVTLLLITMSERK
jgi:hypothetical protein